MSFYRGVVTAVDDPEGLLRVKAKVPQIYGTNESDWIWPAIPIAMGVQAPAVGGSVWVTLEADDPSRPVWVGVWRTRPEGGIDPDLIFGAVVSQTTYGLSPTNGLAYTISRSDHAHGTPPLTAVAPTTIQPDDTPAVGVGTAPARENHRHGIVTDLPIATVFGDTALEGVSTAFSRADHRHDRTADQIALVTLQGRVLALETSTATGVALQAAIDDAAVMRWMTRVG